tara:strand:+ start:379 stop:528 length:150 start_codon:yes stop_codon:yes gene_type:complete
MHNFNTNYEKFLEVLDTLAVPKAFYREVHRPKLNEGADRFKPDGIIYGY